MIRTFFKIGIRYFVKQKGFTFLNLLGLAAGMAAFLFVILYVDNEFGYEKFNDKADRINRVYIDGQIGNVEIKDAISPDPMAEVLMDEFPEVELALRYRNKGRTLVTYENNKFYEEEIFWTDSCFFNMFSIPLIKGDRNNILKIKNTVVLTKPLAEIIFGTDDPIGKIIELDDDNIYEITGVCEKPPKDSHLSFSMLISYSSGDDIFPKNWGSNHTQTYVLVKDGASKKDLESHFPGLVTKYMGPIIQAVLGISLDQFHEQGSRYGFFLEPLLGIHLESATQREEDGMGSKTFIYIIGIIGLFILIIACINYINLSTAKSFLRAKEIGVRKVVGASRLRLIQQFLTESIILSIVALLVALLVLLLLLPSFNNFTGKDIEFDILFKGRMIIYLFGIIILTGIVSGGYNAFYVSSIKPSSVLKNSKSSSKRSYWFRNGLVIFQFAISIFLIISTSIVYSQIKYLQTRDLGFKKEGIIVVESVQLLGKRYNAFKEELNGMPEILHVSASLTVPGKQFSNKAITPEGAELSEAQNLYRLHVDYDYLETMGLEMIDGQFFSPEYATHSDGLILNEAAIRSLELEDPFNEFLIEPGDSLSRRPIIGIIKDINFNSLYTDISPMAMEFIGNRIPSFISVNITAGKEQQVLDYLKLKWDEFIPRWPFEYFFLDEELDALCVDEIKLGKLFGIFSFIAIFIACLGLLGLASYSAITKTKEIGIRKVHGASVSSISSLLIREYLKWVLIANIFAWFLSYWAMDKWLENFSFSCDIRIWSFIAAGLTSTLIVVFTVGYHAISAAGKNPVHTLKHE